MIYLLRKGDRLLGTDVEDRTWLHVKEGGEGAGLRLAQGGDRTPSSLRVTDGKEPGLRVTDGEGTGLRVTGGERGPGSV